MAGVDLDKPKTRPGKKSGIKSAPMPGTKKSGVRKKMDGKVEWTQPRWNEDPDYGD